MDQTQDIQNKKAATSSWKVWLATLLTLIAWCTLVWLNGYAALGIGALALAAGIWSLFGNDGAMRKIAIADIIASTVLIVVLLAFLIVIKIGLKA